VSNWKQIEIILVTILFIMTPNPAFSMDDFAKALDQYDYQFEKGQIVRGRVDQHTSDGAFIDIGGKSSAFISLREISLENVPSIAEALPIDAEFDFLITRGQDAEGQVTLSLRQLLLQKAWENVREISESGKSVQLRVTGVNKGGVTGEVDRDVAPCNRGFFGAIYRYFD